MHEDRLQRVVKEFSAREKARRDRASILDRQTKDEYRALSEAKRQYERKFSEREHAAARLAWRNKDAAAKLLQQQQYEREYKVHACSVVEAVVFDHSVLESKTRLFLPVF